MIHEYKIKLTVEKSIDNKKYEEPYSCSSTYVTFDEEPNKKVKCFLENDKQFHREELKKLLGLLLLQFYDGYDDDDCMSLCGIKKE